MDKGGHKPPPASRPSRNGSGNSISSPIFLRTGNACRHGRTGDEADRPGHRLHQRDQTDQPRYRDHHLCIQPGTTEGSEMYQQVLNSVFIFPQKLEDWISPHWESFVHQEPLTPWLTPEMINKIKDFETVLNGYYPTASDIRLTNLKKKYCTNIASFAVQSRTFKMPYELKALQYFGNTSRRSKDFKKTRAILPLLKERARNEHINRHRSGSRK